jgi:hypothetical protein
LKSTSARTLSGAICYFADPAAKERIIADHAEQRLDFAVRKQVLAMERKLIVEAGLTGVLFKLYLAQSLPPSAIPAGGVAMPLASLCMLSKRSAMRNLVGRLAAVVMLAAAAMAVTAIGTPAVSSACEPGQYWEPFSKACLPLGVGPQPLACEPGQWWDPSGNICRPLGVGPQPLACDPGQWWDPTTNVCRPLGVGPPAG